MTNEIKVLDHGFVKLLNLSGPVRRQRPAITVRKGKTVDRFDADDIDPALVARTSFNQDDLVGGIVEAVDMGADAPRTREQELKLVKYLMDNRHTTPLEMIVCWIEMKMPIFVARQLVRHRTVSINEVSARYVQLDNEFYIPELENVGVKSESNKQGRNTDGSIPEVAGFFSEALEQHCDNAYGLYEKFINQGVPNELARTFLPVNIYTRWVWKQDLHNMMHMLRLRMDPHAQFEIRQYADAIFNLLEEQLPDLMGFFKETL